MTIECYYSSCKYHGIHEIPAGEGPFCYEEDCRATEEEVEQYEKERREYLERYTK